VDVLRGAACAKPRLDVVTRNAINQGLIPGPRYLAGSQEITVAGGLGDETLPHLPFPEFSFGVIVSGAEEMRKVVRMFLKYGVDHVKLNLSGDNFTATSPAGTTWMSDEEVAIAVREAHMRGKRVAAHARSCESIKQCVRHGVEIIYHASFTDEEALDMLEANRDKHFVAPRHRHPRRHARSRGAVGHHPRQGHRDGLRGRAGRGRRVPEEDAQARHPGASRRGLRLRLHPPLRECP
jgi:imidazolonepropionase-like amidohydrolase